MSDLFGRSFRLAKTYLDAAKGRLDEISTGAQEELTRALNRDDIQAGLSASDDPMERAQAKIAAARQASASRTELAPERAVPDAIPAPAAPQTDPLQTAYKILGVPPGSDFLTVQTAANKLRERCAPSRFPDGTQEQTEAKMILQKVEEAYQVLQNALDPSAGRFDKLEI
ncbi:MAG: J domain-containing protein [Armatimonadota bacterium]|nr:J domain-containing protein [Armatimonadota bacterium]